MATDITLERVNRIVCKFVCDLFKTKINFSTQTFYVIADINCSIPKQISLKRFAREKRLKVILNILPQNTNILPTHNLTIYPKTFFTIKQLDEAYLEKNGDVTATAMLRHI